jgi:hypothetical protein
MRFYEQLKRQLPEGCYAWHRIDVITDRGEQREADFVIGQQGRGILVVEVKGRQIEEKDRFLPLLHRSARYMATQRARIVDDRSGLSDQAAGRRIGGVLLASSIHRRTGRIPGVNRLGRSGYLQRPGCGNLVKARSSSRRWGWTLFGTIGAGALAEAV